MEVIGFSRETKFAFSETEMEVAEQLMQLSEDDTLSCSSCTGWGINGCEGGGNTKRHEDVVSSEIHEVVGQEQNDVVRMVRDNNVTDGRSFVKANTETNIIKSRSFVKAVRETSRIRRYKKKKFRSLVSIYRATKEMRD